MGRCDPRGVKGAFEIPRSRRLAGRVFRAYTRPSNKILSVKIYAPLFRVTRFVIKKHLRTNILTTNQPVCREIEVLGPPVEPRRKQRNFGLNQMVYRQAIKKTQAFLRGSL